MRLFFLEATKLTFFLLGSNTAREEIIAAPCCVSLVCGKGEGEGHAAPVQKRRVMVGRVAILPTSAVYTVRATVVRDARWFRQPLSNSFPFVRVFVSVEVTIKISSAPPQPETVCASHMDLV